MIAAAGSELLKLQDRTYWVGAAGMAAFMTVAMLMTVGGADEEPSDRGPAGLIPARGQLAAHDGLGAALGNGSVFLGITALTLVALNVGSEYGLGTIRNLLVRHPRRVSLLLGKVVTLAGYIAIAAALAAAVGFLAALTLAPGNEVETRAWLTTSGWKATVGGLFNLVIATWGWGVLGLLLALVVRSGAAAIGAGVAYALPGEVLLTAVLADTASWLPGQVLQAVALGGTPMLDHRVALLRALLWIVGALVIAIVVFRRQEIGD